MRAALSNNNTLDRRATAQTRLSLLVIDMDMIVVVASFSPEITIIVKGGTSMLKPEGKHCNDTLI